MGTEWGEGVPCAAGCCARSVRAYSGGLRLRRMRLHIFSSLSIYPSASSVSCPPFTLLFHVCIPHAGVPRPSYAGVVAHLGSYPRVALAFVFDAVLE
jgi:hypothetical protein